ncbi:neuroblast differentiation-associated protein AHNAK-like [Takifugu flavidus]|uniref:neuroblast differentiation-associated protein AHNAK-like n=1 Tax=Takifugu flavidus TaxID=433684 RepID=UPI0025447CA2|nr:neuroblast differentiation-associated protein AHNAK-like [Takifugu flavidus]
MPNFKLPKFGVSAPSVTMEAPEKDVKIEGGHINIPEVDLKVDIEAPQVDIEGPSIEMKPADVDHEGKGLKFKMPSLGFSVPQVKQHEIDLSLSRKDVDVKLPEAKVEVHLPEVELKEPSAEIEVQAPGIKVKTKSKEDSPSRFKMPNFKLPKFGVSAPSVTMEAPEKDVKIEGGHINIPEADLKVDIEAPKVDIEGPSIEMKPADVDHEGKGLKFKMPSFGFSGPQVKQHEIDLSLSRKDVDVKLPEAKVEVQLPEVELKEPSAEIEVQAPGIKVKTKSKEDSPSRFKMPNFKLPKFGVSAPSVTMEAPEKDVKIEGGHINIPEVDLKVDIEAPKVDIEGPSIEMKPADVDHERKGLKFKMPSFGFSGPQVKQHEIDLSLSRKDVDVKLPEAKVEVQLPEVELKEPSAEIEVQGPGIKVKTKSKEDSPSRFKMPNFKLPKFGVSAPSVTIEAPEKDVKIEGGHINIPEADLKVDIEAPKVDVEGPSIEMKPADVDHEGKGLKFKMPSLGFSVPQVKQHEIDLSLSRKDVDVKLPEAKVEVHLPEVELKEPSAEIEVQAPEIKVKTKSKEDSPSRFKMPNFKLPKFGVSAPSVTIEAPEKDVKIEGGHINIPEADLKVDIEAPKVDVEGPSIEMKPANVDHEGKGLKFKMPSFGFSGPQVKQHEIDLSLSRKDVDVKLPEAKVEVHLPEVELKEPSAEIEVQAPEIKVKTKSKEDSPSRFKMPNFKLPKFGVSAPSVTIEAPEKDVKIEGGDIYIPEEVLTVDIEGTLIQMKTTDAHHEEKGNKLKMPSLGFSRLQVKQPESSFSTSKKNVKDSDIVVNLETPKVDVAAPEAKLEVFLPDVEVKKPSVQTPAAELVANVKKSKFSLSGFHFSKGSGEEAEIIGELSPVDVSLSEAEVKVKHSEMETESGGQQIKFNLPKFQIAVPEVRGPNDDLNALNKNVDVHRAQTDEYKLKEDVSVTIKGPSVDIKTNEYKGTDTEIANSETNSLGLGSPSKFKLPSFKMPKLNFSRAKPQDELIPVESEGKDELKIEIQLKGEGEIPNVTSIRQILNNSEIEFERDKDDYLEQPKEVLNIAEPLTEQKQMKIKEITTKHDTTKSPERTGWFKFPKFGLSSPSSPAKTPEYDEKKCPIGEMVDEEISPTGSVQSSDAFADISSAMTSENLGLSLSSPTKVTVKYSDSNTVTGSENMDSKVITSTTRTEQISVEPNLPEKVTILSSGVSSSSEDTLRLESGKIHVIASNIQMTPEAQHALLLNAVQLQPAGGPHVKSETDEAASWTVKDSQGGKRTIFERHLVRKTSSERSESKETVVITKQITRTSRFESSEPISGETATSIQQLRQSVHSEKMRFFDGMEK